MIITMTSSDDSCLKYRNDNASAHPQPPNAYYKAYNLPVALFLLRSIAAMAAIVRSFF